MEQFDQYVENWLDSSKYGMRYRENAELLAGKKVELLQTWVSELMDAATKEALPNHVIQSFIAIFSETVLLQTFRGVYGKGLQNYAPINKEMAHKQNPMMF